MGRVCLVCQSLYEDEYSKLYGLGRGITDILNYARKRGDTFSYNSLARHLKSHSGNRQVSTGKDREKLLKEELWSTINIIRKLNKSLEICSNKIDSLVRENSPELLKYLGEARMTIETLRNFLKDFNITELDEKEDIFSRIIYCMRDLPVEYLDQFRNRWEEYNKSV